MNNSREVATELIFGRWRSQILHAGVKLGVFDAIADQSRSYAEVAEQLSLDAENTYRLLRALASIGALEERSDKVFKVSSVGEFFRADNPQSLRGMTLLEEGAEHYAIWKHLCDIVREGERNGFVREFGCQVFEHIGADPNYAAVFNEAMSSFSAGETMMALEALADYDFSVFSNLCDIGGGQGHLLCSALAKHSNLKGIVFELPGTIENKSALWAEKLGVQERCEYVGGDMFKETPSADAYFMKHILHDWNDEECVSILSNVHASSPADARVFVCEFVVPDPATPHFSKLFDVHMLCATTGGERTESEYAALFDSTGWKYVKTWNHPSQLLAVVEAVKS
jgi:O-methyltransferase domain/Dimerisation domain